MRAGFAETGGFTGNRRFSSGDDQFLLAGFRKMYGKRSVMFALHRDAIVSTNAEKTLGGFLYQRFRWVSKSKGYRDPVVIATGALTWLFNTVLLACLVAGIFHGTLLQVSLVCLGIKMVSELPMVAGMAVFFRSSADLWLYLPSQIFQVIYVPFAGLLGLVIPYRWKGRFIRA